MTHDPETKKAAIRMFMDGHTPQEISEELGVKRPTVYTWTKDLRVDMAPRKKEVKFNLEAALERLTYEELYPLVNSDELKMKAADMKEWRKRINSILQARDRPDPEEQRVKNWRLLTAIWGRKLEERKALIPPRDESESDEPEEKTEVETIAPFWESDEDTDEE